MSKKIKEGLRKFNKKLENNYFFSIFLVVILMLLTVITLGTYKMWEVEIDDMVSSFNIGKKYKEYHNEFLIDNKILYDEREIYLKNNKEDRKEVFNKLDGYGYSVDNDFSEFYYKGVWVKNIFETNDFYENNLSIDPDDITFEENIKETFGTIGHYLKPHDLIKDTVNFYINEIGYKEKDFLNLKFFICYCDIDKVNGQYYSETNSIVIDMKNYSPTGFLSTLNHEIGHFIDYNKFKTKDRYNYFKLFKEKELGVFKKEKEYNKNNLNEIDAKLKWKNRYGEILAEDFKFNSLTNKEITKEEQEYLIELVKETKTNNNYNY